MKQSLASAAMAVALCAFVSWIFWDDVGYFMQKPVPRDLGAAGEIDSAVLMHNSFVTVKGVADFRVQFAEAGGKTYRYFILLGSRILVEQETQSTVSKGEPWNFSGAGRLLALEKTLKYDQFVKHLRDNPPRVDLGAGGFILKDGERPRDVWPYLAAVCVSIAVAVLSLLRLFVLSRRDGPVVSSDA